MVSEGLNWFAPKKCINLESFPSTANDTFWDFISLTPESMHMVMWIMSDRTLPRSLRMIEGFGVHSFRLVNGAGESTFVKFHWRPKLGLQSTVWDETVKISGADPDYHRRDMFEAIEAGAFPAWEFGVQLFTQEEADKFPFDHLDATKLIPEELVPLQIIGRLVGGARLADGSLLPADGQPAGTPSVLFDAVAVILSKEGAKALSAKGSAIDFARDAFGHLKAIGVDAGGRALLKTANVGQDAGVVDAGDKDAFIAAAKTRQWDREKYVRTLA